jgi:hypothetical protein
VLRRGFFVSTLLIASAVVPAAHAAGGPALFEVGAAVRSLDPSVPVYSGGFSLSPPISQLRDPLQVRAFYVSDGKHAVEVAVVDAQGAFAAYQEGPQYGYDAIRVEAAKAIAAETHTDMTSDDIVMQTTHTHAGPTLEGIWGPVPLPYLQEVRDEAVQALVAAAQSARPAHLQWALIDDRDIAGVNLDQDSYQGWSNDQQLSILRAVNPRTGATIATFAQAPTHGAQICGQCKKILSADWFGAVRAQLDRQLGGISVVGPATLGRQESPVETTGGANMVWLARMIAGDLEHALVAARWVTEPTVGGVSTMLSVPATNAALLQLNDDWALPDDAKDAEAQASGIYPIDRANTPPYRTGQVLGTWITALRIGRLAFVSAPGEPFPELRAAVAHAVQGTDELVELSKSQDDFGYLYPSWVVAFPAVYQSDHHIFSVAPQAGDQVVSAQTSELGSLGFLTDTPVDGPVPIRPGQKLEPGLQTGSSPRFGDAGAHGAFAPVLQATFSPASPSDEQLQGKVHWDFGDGTSADTGYLEVGQDYGQTGQGAKGATRFRHPFRPGRYTIRATATDTGGKRAEWSSVLRVYPRLHAEVAVRPAGPGRVALRAIAEGGDEAVLAASWRLAGGARMAGVRLVRTVRPGDRVALSIVDGNGETARTTCRLRPRLRACR